MGFYERLMGVEQPKLRVHSVMSAFAEWERGNMTQAQIVAAFGLSASEEAEAVALLGAVKTPLESISLGGFTTLANIGASYDGSNASRGLGVIRLECAGITGFEFGVSVNKIGSGTQSWQLWNETDAAEVAVINDNGAAGNKQLSTTASFAPMPPGIKTIRVRAKSTTAADDPLYYGASLLVSRVARLTSVELHEVLILAESRIAPLNTVAAVKTRLGVS